MPLIKPGNTGALDHQDISQGKFRNQIAQLVNKVLDLEARIKALEAESGS